jgi:hypothetical protein
MEQVSVQSPGYSPTCNICGVCVPGSVASYYIASTSQRTERRDLAVGQSGGPFSDKRSIPSSQPQTIYPNRSCGTSYFSNNLLLQALTLCYSILLIPHTPSKLPRGYR